ncbi:hypothetical protein J3Q64DRAFT_1750923, partial [Phycomyces blakesleeanus]
MTSSLWFVTVESTIIFSLASEMIRVISVLASSTRAVIFASLSSTLLSETSAIEIVKRRYQVVIVFLTWSTVSTMLTAAV